MAETITITEYLTAPRPSKAEMLADIDSSITAILRGGQAYTIGSRKMTRADLAQLYKMRQEIESQIAADEGATGLIDDCYVAVFSDTR